MSSKRFLLPQLKKNEMTCEQNMWYGKHEHAIFLNKRNLSLESDQAHRRNVLQVYDGATLQMQWQEPQTPELHQQQHHQR
jgi:hypothetical protein